MHSLNINPNYISVQQNPNKRKRDPDDDGGLDGRAVKKLRLIEIELVRLPDDLPQFLWLKIISYVGVDKKFTAFYQKTENEPRFYTRNIDKRAPFPGWMVLEALENKQFEHVLTLLQNKCVEYTRFQIERLWDWYKGSNTENNCKKRFIELVQKPDPLTGAIVTLAKDQIDVIQEWPLEFSSTIQLYDFPENTIKKILTTLYNTCRTPPPQKVRKAIFNRMQELIVEEWHRKETGCPLIKFPCSIEQVVSIIEDRANSSELFKFIYKQISRGVVPKYTTLLFIDVVIAKILDNTANAFEALYYLKRKLEELKSKLDISKKEECSKTIDVVTESLLQCADFACIQGHTKIVEKMLELTGNFFFDAWHTSALAGSPPFFGTALAKACKAGQLEVIKLFLADPRTDEGYILFALRSIAESKDLNVFNTFRESGKLTQANYESLLIISCKQGNLAIIKKIMDENLVSANTIHLVLRSIAKSKDLNVFNTFHESGKLTQANYESLLIISCKQENLAIIKKGIDENIVSTKEISFNFNESCLQKYTKSALCIVQHEKFKPKDDFDANFRFACELPENEVAKAFIENNRFGNANDYFLMAAKRGSINTFNKLIDMGYLPPTEFWEALAAGLQAKLEDMAKFRYEDTSIYELVRKLNVKSIIYDLMHYVSGSARDKIEAVLSVPEIDDVIKFEDDNRDEDLECHPCYLEFERLGNYKAIYEKLVALPNLSQEP